MAMGVPVIITNFSGCQDYANADTCTLLEPAGFLLHPQMDNVPQHAGKKFAHVTVSEIRKAMRRVLDNPDEISQKAKTGKEFVRSRFTYSSSAAAFTTMLEDLNVKV
jgi:glycosyltransferase involved in cell wall biosynthesis